MGNDAFNRGSPGETGMKLPQDKFTSVRRAFIGLIQLVILCSASQVFAEVVTTIELQDELTWQFETDIGTMHFYDGGQLWSVDLLQDRRRVSVLAL